MGKRGPAKTPAKIKKLNGTFLKGRDLDDGIEPPASTYRPAPESLKAEGRRIWETYRQRFIDDGVLTEYDEESFYLLCESFDNVHYCREALEEHGYLTVRGDSMVRSPIAVQRDQFVKEQDRLLAKFGMAPNERGGIQIKSGVDDGFEPKP